MENAVNWVQHKNEEEEEKKRNAIYNGTSIQLKFYEILQKQPHIFNQ